MAILQNQVYLLQPNDINHFSNQEWTDLIIA
jgi:hypothetical protein